MNQIKFFILYLSKMLGMFHLSKYLSVGKLRILCYHGFSYRDQSSFRPKLYIEEKSFKKRMEYLVGNKFTILSLENFDNYLKGKLTCKNPVFLTIDDGWKSTHEIALPILKKYGIPHVIYLYTDCCQRNIPAVNVLLQYALWKTPLETVIYAGSSYNLNDTSACEELLQQFISVTKLQTGHLLNKMLEEIFHLLDVGYSNEQDWRNFSFLSADDIKDHLQNNGSFQLHTHHHINPLEDDLLTEELLENKLVIKELTGQIANHFCYPSGVYSSDQFPLLKKLGIKSAVTCIPGLNDNNCHRYELKRFLDGENITQLVFEAEMCGFMDIARRIFRR